MPSQAFAEAGIHKITVRKSMLRITRKIIFLGFYEVFIPSNSAAKSELLLGVTNFCGLLGSPPYCPDLLLFDGQRAGSWASVPASPVAVDSESVLNGRLSQQCKLQA